MTFRNAANWDRALRIALGVTMLVLGWVGADAWTVWMRVGGLYPLITGVIGWCPIYALSRVDTYRPAKGESPRRPGR